MRKLAAVATTMLAVGTSGCATSQPDPAFSRLDGVQMSSDGYQNNFFKSAEFSRPGYAIGSDALPLCITRSIQNREVTLTDAQGSGFGAYTGNYYSNSNSREAGGGNVLAFVSDDGKEVIANGTSSYEFKSGFVPIKRVVRFSLAVKAVSDKTSYVFDNLEQAQTSTGILSNDGFNKIGAWSGANPNLAHQSLVELVDEVNSCLASK